ncbi:MAG: hypothetical protein KDD45_08550, partial [Bdellovibrionales bacterium]|nr:hypothetical protein [Bdellovibrionales bacterium]
MNQEAVVHLSRHYQIKGKLIPLKKRLARQLKTNVGILLKDGRFFSLDCHDNWKFVIWKNLWNQVHVSGTKKKKKKTIQLDSL